MMLDGSKVMRDEVYRVLEFWVCGSKGATDNEDCFYYSSKL
jgi:hypothetical protein